MPAPARPKLQTPLAQVPDFQMLMLEMTPKESVPQKPRLREGLTEDKTAGTESVVELVERKQRQIELQEAVKQRETEQRQKEAAALEVPALEIGSIVTEEPAREVKTPIERKQSDEACPRCKDAEAVERSTSVPVEPPSIAPVSSSGVSDYAKIGAGILAALFGISGLGLGLWHFGKGIYDNLEYR